VIRVLLAEDQAMMRGALAVLLQLEDDIEVVAEVDDGADIVPRALALEPDVAMLDIELPHLSGLDAAAQLAEQLPGCRVLIVTTFSRPGYLQRAMAAGARGFLVKDGPADGLADAIRTVVAGGTVVDPELAGVALRAASCPLTPRECRCSQRPSTAPRSPTSPGGSTSPRAPSATTCRRPSARPAPATRWRPRSSRGAAGGCSRARLVPVSLRG
jgi:two-component system response regulator DesR